MLLARLVKFLNLDKAVQQSFDEYLSKPSFVERCHAAGNKALERHETFSSKHIHPSAVPGTEAHKAAIDGTTINKEPIRCLGGVADHLVYDSSLCNDPKESCDLCYSAVKNGIYRYLSKTWELNITSQEVTLMTTAPLCYASSSKYPVSVFQQDDKWHGKMQEKIEKEPIPDLLRLEQTRAMHYLPYMVPRDLPEGEWDGITQLFLCSDILNLSQKVFFPKPTQDILFTIAFYFGFHRIRQKKFLLLQARMQTY